MTWRIYNNTQISSDRKTMFYLTCFSSRLSLNGYKHFIIWGLTKKKFDLSKFYNFLNFANSPALPDITDKSFK